MKLNDLGMTIVNGACNREAEEAALEIAELGLHRLLTDELLKQLPILRTVVACRATWGSIRDQFFLKKVATFIFACPKIPDAARENFLNGLADNQKQAKKLSDTLVILLDRLDDLEKPEMLAKVFTGYVRGRFPLECFRRLASAIDIGFLEDLQGLTHPPEKGGEQSGVWLQNLLRTGLSIIKERDNFEGYFRGTYTGLEVSALGRIFIECMNETP